jgi:hypothetical protein
VFFNHSIKDGFSAGAPAYISKANKKYLFHYKYEIVREAKIEEFSELRRESKD